MNIKEENLLEYCILLFPSSKSIKTQGFLPNQLSDLVAVNQGMQMHDSRKQVRNMQKIKEGISEQHR